MTSCKSENDLEGIWIGAYQIYYSGNDSTLTSIADFIPADTSYISMRALFDISENEITKKTFDNLTFDEKGSIKITAYSVSGKSLIVDTDTLRIKSLSKDSLVLSPHPDYLRDFVLKRLPEKNKKEKINIENKAFSLIGANYADSIDFINDSLVLHIGNTYDTRYRSRHWAINSYKSLDFLIFDQIASPPLLIAKCSDKEVSLKLYYTTIQDFKMTEIDYVKDTLEIERNKRLSNSEEKKKMK